MQRCGKCYALCTANPVRRERERNGKSDATCHAMHCQRARNSGTALTWHHPIADERDGRIRLDIEEVGTTQVIVAKVHVGIDALRLNHRGDRRAFGMLLVVDDRRFVIVEATADLYRAQQCRSKADGGMHSVDGIARRRNLGGRLRAQKRWTATPEDYRSKGQLSAIHVRS